MNRQESLFPGYEYEPPPPESPLKYHKPIEMYGPGPEGKTCKTCANLLNRDWKYKKCSQWKQSMSPATDVRFKWPACGRYKEKPEDHDEPIQAPKTTMCN